MRLLPYPASPPFVQNLRVTVTLAKQCDGFRIEHLVEGAAVETLALAAPTVAPRRRDELWKHSCMEAFFAVAGSTRYYEFNGSPSGDWALYRFDDYRQGMSVQDTVAPPSLCEREQTPDRLRCVWHIPFFCDDALDRAGITAILQCRDVPDVSSYWALHHAGKTPDFHRRESFLYSLDVRSMT